MISYVFQELCVIKLAKRVNGIVQSGVRSTDRSIQFIDRTVHQMRAGNHVVLQVVNLLKESLIMGKLP